MKALGKKYLETETKQWIATRMPTHVCIVVELEFIFLHFRCDCLWADIHAKTGAKQGDQMSL
jgi:hypothetical protein